MSYDEISALANQAGYGEFTSLQRQSFTNENFYDVSKWLFIIGATGSGKTLVAFLSYFFEKRRRGLPYRMLFAVPYRALASQKTDEINGITRALDLDLKIAQSTSEYLLDDKDIMNGDVDIAIIINEKIFMFASSDDTFLEHYDLIVLDEVALLQDDVRGIKTDFILLKAKDVPSLRVIALGTPFYNWSEYIKKFGFTEILEMDRPIEIREFPVFYNASGITKVEADCQAIGVENFVTGSLEKSIPRANNYITTSICKFHLQRNAKIIIFMNHRQNVRDLALVLKRELIDTGILSPWIDESECKKYIRQEIQAESLEILHGIMDNNDISAFAHGIIYHNADMPSTLRYMIERDLLSENGHIRVVCSTETLAYGINSSADVVIIPSMQKKDYSASAANNKKRFLLPNEYMNYAGRAGRLNPHLPLSNQKNVGYVYPILSDTKRERKAWKLLNSQILKPSVIFSKYMSIQKDYLPFYILSLFPSSYNAQGLSEREIQQLLLRLPLSEDQSENIESTLRRSLDDLLETRLIYLANEDDDDDEDFVKKYAVTDVGRKVSGFIITFEDFKYISNSVHSFFNFGTADTPEVKFMEVDLFNLIISTSEIMERGKAIIGNLNWRAETDPNWISRAVEAMKKIFRKAERQTNQKLYKEISKSIKQLSEQRKQYAVLVDDDRFRAIMLAAVLLWLSDDCTPPTLYNAFKIHYEQMRRLMEIVIYRLDILRYSFRYSLTQFDGNKHVNRKLTESGRRQELLNEAELWLKNLSEEISYQPSNEILKLLDIKYCDLYKAQKLHSFESAFKLLRNSEENSEPLSEIQRNNIKTKMCRWYPSWRDKFREQFPNLI